MSSSSTRSTRRTRWSRLAMAGYAFRRSHFRADIILLANHFQIRILVVICMLKWPIAFCHSATRRSWHDMVIWIVSSLGSDWSSVCAMCNWSVVIARICENVFCAIDLCSGLCLLCCFDQNEVNAQLKSRYANELIVTPSQLNDKTKCGRWH